MLGYPGLQTPDRLREATSPLKVVKLLGAIWLGLLLYNILTQISGLLTIHDYNTNFMPLLLFMTLKIWLPWVVLSPAVVWLARRFPFRPENWNRAVLTHAGLLLGLSLIAGSALSFHYHFREEMNEVMKTYEPWQHIGHFLFGDSLFLYNAVIYTVFIAGFNIQNFYQLAVQRERDSAALTTQLKDAELQALKMQINPHFLFNTLNSISTLVLKEDNKRAQQMIQRLGRFFRATLDDASDQWVSLEKELDMVEQYLGIEQVRFGDRVVIKTDYDPAAMDIQIPSLVLQPIVENAIRHGITEISRSCELKITTRLENSRLVITVADNGSGCDFDAVSFSGVGLTNVRSRLAQCYGDAGQIQLEGQPGAGVRVTLDLPVSP